MKYILKQDLPTFKAGTEAWLSKRGNLLARVGDTEITIYMKDTLDKFPNILTEWFTPVEEKRKVVPVVPDKIYTISATWYTGETAYGHSVGELTINQGNWRWTEEEAELEIRKRAAIERVRRYLVSNDLIEEDKSKTCIYIVWNPLRQEITFDAYNTFRPYSPYWLIKYVNVEKFIEDCREDLLMIHS